MTKKSFRIEKKTEFLVVRSEPLWWTLEWKGRNLPGEMHVFATYNIWPLFGQNCLWKTQGTRLLTALKSFFFLYPRVGDQVNYCHARTAWPSWAHSKSPQWSWLRLMSGSPPFHCDFFPCSTLASTFSFCRSLTLSHLLYYIQAGILSTYLLENQPSTGKEQSCSLFVWVLSVKAVFSLRAVTQLLNKILCWLN